MFHLFIPSTPELLVTTDLFTVFIVLPFSQHRIAGFIQYVAFLDWPLSLCNMHLRIHYVLMWLISSVLFSVEYYSIVWMYHSLIIPSPVEGHLGCFQVLTVMNKTAINIHFEGFSWKTKFSTHVGKYQGM